jgi:hypothetical protein
MRALARTFAGRRVIAGVLLLTAPLVVHAQMRGRGWNGVLPENFAYNGRFTFSPRVPAQGRLCDLR